MKIFVIGYSGIGKSPFTNKLLAKFADAQLISASEWVRSKFEPGTSAEVLTLYSKEQLKNNPNSCVSFITQKYDLDNKITIIEGIRNPYDFNRLFDYTKDIVIFLSREGLVSMTSFEENGVLAIKTYTNFLLLESMLEKSRVLYIHFSSRNKYSTNAIVIPDLNSLILNDLEDAIFPLEKFISRHLPSNNGEDLNSDRVQ
jgi:shikimate kinase